MFWEILEVKNNMKDCEKRIEDVAKNFSNVFSEREMFVKGAKSDVAKEYWQQGMYSEQEVEELAKLAFSKALNIDGFNPNVGYNQQKFDEWFNNNKK